MDETCETLAFKNEKDKNIIEQYCQYIPLPEKNIVTQCDGNIFFTVFYPFELIIKCDDITEHTILKNHSKITNNTQCILTGKIFSIFPNANTDSMSILNPADMRKTAEKRFGNEFSEAITNLVMKLALGSMLALMTILMYCYIKIIKKVLFTCCCIFPNERRERQEAIRVLPGIISEALNQPTENTYINKRATQIEFPPPPASTPPTTLNKPSHMKLPRRERYAYFNPPSSVVIQ